MHTYTLVTPMDQHGQPVQLFRANRENNICKAVDQLSGICSGIVADGIVNVKEATFFAEWIRKYRGFEPVWPFTDILARIERIFADGRCDQEECDELKAIMQALCGHTSEAKPEDTYSTTLPLDSPAPEPIIFSNRIFTITGKFAFGTRRKVMDAVSACGGTATDSAPTRESSYLLVGTFASRDWINTNYGRKIERAVELRQSGSGIAIISEEHWKKFVA
jgi:hypothetical protein